MKKEIVLRLTPDEYLRIPDQSNGQKDYSDILRKHMKKSPHLYWRIMKKSIDARKKQDIRIVLSLLVWDEKKDKNVTKLPMRSVSSARNDRPVVVGFGPAGIFAALTLARQGHCPVIIERGKKIEDRVKDVEKFFISGKPDPESNIQFGEGGAGAFSDGKLYSGIKSEHKSTVLEAFVQAGAKESILYDSQPHVGTDYLRIAVRNLRQEIESLGGEFLFSCEWVGVERESGKLTGAIFQRYIDGKKRIEKRSCSYLILAVGHSARNTFSALYDQGIKMEKKPFAVGVRIEHPQTLIDQSQYGGTKRHPALPPASYKLAVKTQTGRDLYTFCMCPGGYVIPGATQEGQIVTNGMSYQKRDGENANSALLVGVTDDDLDTHPLSGIDFQEDLEKKAYVLGGNDGFAPCQRVEDFLAGREPSFFKDIFPTYRPGVKAANLRLIFPSFINDTLDMGIREMGKKIKDFSLPDALLTAVETRSSSPVRIVRDKNSLQSVSLLGLFPCGEGAGYAGGIMSSAVDGITCAQIVSDLLEI